MADTDLREALRELEDASPPAMARLLQAFLNEGDPGLEAAWREVVAEALDEA
jgi:hypothetical protein